MVEELLAREARRESFAPLLSATLNLEGESKPCMRCALRFAGVWDGKIYQASDAALASALSTILSSPIAPPAATAAPCPLCLGALQCVRPDVAFCTPLVEKVMEIRQSRADDLEGASMAMSLSLPHFMTFRDMACWECMKEACASHAEQAGRSGRFVEVKDALKAALDGPLADALGLQSDGAHGTYKVAVAIVHPSVDKEDFENGIKPLLPSDTVYHGHGGRRSKKRKWGQGGGGGGGRGEAEEQQQGGSNDENRCTKPIVDKVAALIAKGGPSCASLSSWFKSRRAVSEPARPVIKISRDAIFLRGRYQKLSRQLPQSSWLVDGKRMGKGSVEEIVGDPIIKWCGGQSVVFMAAGREDMDVRMLGKGRPFLLQVNDPRKVPSSAQQVAALEASVNREEGLNAEGDVVVSQLEMSEKSEVKAMQEAAEDKQKFYTCIVWLSAPLPFEQIAEKLGKLMDLTLQQRTPVRVLHRRSLMTRAKVIHEMHIEPINDRFFTLHVRASAGTYIKEFVHGDWGRTEPSVGSLLGCKADILQLDVTDVLHKGEEAGSGQPCIG